MRATVVKGYPCATNLPTSWEQIKEHVKKPTAIEHAKSAFESKR